MDWRGKPETVIFRSNCHYLPVSAPLRSAVGQLGSALLKPFSWVHCRAITLYVLYQVNRFNTINRGRSRGQCLTDILTSSLVNLLQFSYH